MQRQQQQRRPIDSQAMGWDAVRRWAAASGIRSASAFNDWLAHAASDEQMRSDPRAWALLRTLGQYSMIPSLPLLDPQAPIPQRLLTNYRDLLEALSDPRIGATSSVTPVGRATTDLGSRMPVYRPGFDGPQWVAPLVDPLVQGGRLWPPSPVTLTVRLTEIMRDAFGYAPLDSNALVIALSERPSQGAERPSRASIDTFARKLDLALLALGRLRVDPTAKRLAPDVDIAKARERWPGDPPYGFNAPYVLVIGPGTVRGPYDAWTPADGPVHVALIVQNGEALGRLVVSDETDAIVNATGVLDPRSRRQRRADRPIREAFSGDPQVAVDVLMPFVKAVRAGQPDTLHMSQSSLDFRSQEWRRTQGLDEPYVMRAIEPAEFLAAIDQAKRNRASRAIDEITASTTGELASLAARAFRGDVATANVPHEVRQLAAAQAIARACSPGSTLQDRARVLGAARVLGISDSLVQGDLTRVCQASADAIRQLYGRL